MSRSHNLGIIAGVSAVACLFCGCSGNTENASAPVPLPVAWPRPVVYPDSFRTETVKDVCFSVNNGAAIEMTGTGADISYPAYDATVYLSVNTAAGTDPAAFEHAWQGRRERMALNLGGAVAEEITCQRPEWNNPVVVTSKTVSQTPVQFLAGDRRHGVIVSGAVFMHGWDGTEPYDSVRPLVEALQRDMLELVNTLRYAPPENP